MNYPDILFKVISNDVKNQSMVIKFCLNASDKPIDEYKAYNISYWNLDFTSTGSLIDSIRNQGLISIINDLSQLLRWNYKFYYFSPPSSFIHQFF